MKNKYIFLDIDGTINTDKNIEFHRKKGNLTNSHNIKFPHNTMYQLQRIVSFTKANIIISSSWRRDLNALNNLQKQFKTYDLSFQGITPIFDCNNSRGRECKWYLDKIYEINGYYPNYVIIDDQIYNLLAFHKGHIIHTDARYGLTEELANIAISILNK